ncbi:metal-dependent hydrolase [[Mycobacterium] kokjensenii]|uniref:Metal-dependent hydrolase n=1 Tax=[Mycobacterium] kokjensenii TaxID=3064287 RepID=A0ABM9LIS3_9MYCO|nr:metal-dependent hydrolase [Mycolicibacter sp. MU0083]CAJ1499723.1 metal-dependent hydrolase [Mycolicibacter sp. MU0083]
MTSHDPARSSHSTGYPKARRIRFRFDRGVDDGDGYGRYFADGDMVLSHFLAGLSGGFPAGEESFIRSVRRMSDRTVDPALKSRVAGFIGQESTHGQEHRRLNELLAGEGYPIRWQDSKAVHRWRIRVENRTPALVHLAQTAALEHYTAILAERILSSREIQAIPGSPEVWNLLNWHAVEELEHKSVALDLYRAAGGSEAIRIIAMAVLIAATVPLVALGLAVSLAKDPVARRRPRQVLRGITALYRGPFFRGFLRDAAIYLRPEFHPDDVNTVDLLDYWRSKLFGPDGDLKDHLR